MYNLSNVAKLISCKTSFKTQSGLASRVLKNHHAMLPKNDSNNALFSKLCLQCIFNRKNP